MSMLYQAMKRVVNEFENHRAGTNVLFGTVKQNPPLVIDLDNKLTLEERYFVVAQHLTDYEIEYELTKTYGDNEITNIQSVGGWYAEHEGQQRVGVNNGSVNGFVGKGTIKLLNHLQKGDRVILIQMEGGQQFVVIDRIGEVKV